MIFACYLYTVTLETLCIHSGRVFNYSLKLSMKTVMSSMNRYSFICSFLMYTSFLFFFLYFTGLVFHYNVQRISEKGNSCLDPILRGKQSLFHIIYDVSCGFLVDAFLSGQEIPLLFLAYLKFLWWTGILNFQMLFFASMRWFFSLFK